MKKLFKNKKILSIAIIAALLILGIIFVIILSLREKDKSIIVPLPSEREPKIESTNIPSRLERVTLNKTLNIRFSEVSEKELQEMVVQVEPEVPLKITVDYPFLEITPEDTFRSNTEYTLKIVHKNKMLEEFSFRTVKEVEVDPELSEEEKTRLQTGMDYEYGQQVNDFLDEYPMFEFLPIETEEYRIIYSIENNRYRIRLKIPSPTEEDKQRLTSEALQELEEKGENIEEIEYVVLTSED
jgi:hypothetical protein